MLFVTVELTDGVTFKLTDGVTFKLTDRVTVKLTDRVTFKLTDGVTFKLTDAVTDVAVGLNTTSDELDIGSMDDAPGNDGEVDNTGVVTTKLDDGCPVVVGCIKVESIVIAAEGDETITCEPLGDIVKLGDRCPFVVVVGCIREESIVIAVKEDETNTCEPLGTIVVIRELIAGNTSVVMTYITPEVFN